MDRWDWGQGTQWVSHTDRVSFRKMDKGGQLRENLEGEGTVCDTEFCRGSGGLPPPPPKKFHT